LFNGEGHNYAKKKSITAIVDSRLAFLNQQNGTTLMLANDTNKLEPAKSKPNKKENLW
jgi:hypothetical protein